MGKPKIYPRVPKIQEEREFLVRDRGNGLKIQPVVYRWTNGVGWVIPANYEVMRMKAINHKPVIRPKGTLALQGGEEVSVRRVKFYLDEESYEKLKKFVDEQGLSVPYVKNLVLKH